MSSIPAQFRDAYASHRAAEGRGLHGAALRALPYLDSGPFAKQWAVRARSFDALVRQVVTPLAARLARPLDILDLGAGNGWLCSRLARTGHACIALDMRDDAVDGLGAAAEFLAETPGLFECVAASFDDLPFAPRRFDIALFNASLHYAQDLRRVLEEAARVTRPGGLVVIVDSPFYRRDADGTAMMAEKKRHGAAQFGAQADLLLGQNFIEYLTPARLAETAPALTWSRRRVAYPLWYELRPVMAWLKGTRVPSRFDLWTAPVT